MTDAKNAEDESMINFLGAGLVSIMEHELEKHEPEIRAYIIKEFQSVLDYALARLNLQFVNLENKEVKNG